jgi:hypothetical protein
MLTSESEFQIHTNNSMKTLIKNTFFKKFNIKNIKNEN